MKPDFTLSNWKLTFDPQGVALVILDFGDILTDELKFPLKRGLDVVNIGESDEPFLRPTGNAATVINFDVLTAEATDGLARQRMLNHMLLVDSLPRKPLRVEVYGINNCYWEYKNCYIQNVEPQRHLDSAFARLVNSYSLTCTGPSGYVTITSGSTHAAVAVPAGQITNTHAAA